MLINSIGVNNALPELIKAVYRILYSLKGGIKSFVKRLVSTINNSFILLVNNGI